MRGPTMRWPVAARSGRLHRNFQGYTADAAPVLLGAGASSIGSLPRGHVQNHMRMPDYARAVRAGDLPVCRGVAFGGQDLARRDATRSIG